MSTSKQVTKTIAVREISQDRYNQLVIVAQPNEYNATGNYVMNAQQEAFLLQKAGIPNRLGLKHLVAMSNNSTKLEFTAQFNKKGETWESKDKTRTGTYEKDWTQFSNFQIKLGFAAQAILADLALQGKLASVQSPATSSAPVAEAPIAEAAEVPGV